MSNLASILVPRKTVKQRLGGVSDMTIWRWEQDRASGFPLPLMMNGRAYYHEHEVAAWISSRPRKAPRDYCTCDGGGGTRHNREITTGAPS